MCRGGWRDRAVEARACTERTTWGCSLALHAATESNRMGAAISGATSIHRTYVDNTYVEKAERHWGSSFSSY